MLRLLQVSAQPKSRMTQGRRLPALGQVSLRSFGIEEEYLLLDRASLNPANHAAQIIRRLRPEANLAEREFLASQLETATSICRTAEEAERSLRAFRSEVSAVAADSGVILVGVGMPPAGGDEAGMVTPRLRYRQIAEVVREVAVHQYGTGTHVHVEVPSRDCGVDVLVRLARWAPVLLALTANSPIWCGRPTGFASWRHVAGLTWPLSGYPPAFTDADQYAQTVAQLIRVGTLLDEGMVTWVARLSHRYPTVEFRIADAQLDVEDSVAYAVLIRALVDRAVREYQDGGAQPSYAPSIVNAALWLAARDGLGAELVDPLSGTTHKAHDLVQAMVSSVRTELECAGDLERVTRYLERRRRMGSPAAVQRRHFDEHGLDGLAALYQSAVMNNSWPEGAST